MWPKVTKPTAITDINALTPEQRFIIDLMVSGYTVPAILARCADRDKSEGGAIDVDYGWVVRAYTDYYGQIIEARRLKDQEILDRGLGRRAERIARLEKHAEAIEQRAEASPQWSKAYVAAIETIDKVAEPLTKNRLPDDDKWVMLLNRITKVSSTAPAAQLSEPPMFTETHPGSTESLQDQPMSSSDSYSTVLDGGPVPPRMSHSEAERESS